MSQALVASAEALKEAHPAVSFVSIDLDQADYAVDLGVSVPGTVYLFRRKVKVASLESPSAGHLAEALKDLEKEPAAKVTDADIVAARQVSPRNSWLVTGT